MNKPLLSICIPTYNRSNYLKECLNSIVIQLEKDKKLIELIEIIISDNNSNDDTSIMVKKFQKKYSMIKYHRNNKNLGAWINTMKFANYTNGNYIWFFSDDDIQYLGSIKRITKTIINHNPDTVLCNSDKFLDNPKNPTYVNNLNLHKDIYVHTKRDFFKILETKFIHTVDWYLFCYSTIIINKKLFDKNFYLLKKVTDYSNMCYPHVVLLYYTQEDYSQYIISKPILTYRANNLSWIIKNRVKFASLIEESYIKYYGGIYNINKKNISFKFAFLLFIKLLVKRLGVIYIWIFSLISSIKLIIKKLLPVKHKKR